LIKLEKLLLDDAGIIADYANNRNIWLNVTDSFPHPYFKLNAVEFINSVKNDIPQRVFKITKGGDFIGLIGVTPKEGIYKIVAEIGYWIAEPFWGKGYGTKAVNLILNYAFDTYKDVTKIVAKVYHTNVASARILVKNGFIQEAILYKEAVKNGELKDIICFRIYRSEFV